MARSCLETNMEMDDATGLFSARAMSSKIMPASRTQAVGEDPIQPLRGWYRRAAFFQGPPYDW
jgi:hypothetical protein